MKPVVLDQISFQPDSGQLAERLRVRPGTRHAAMLEELLEEARNLARPKALYREVDFQVGQERVTIDQVALESRLLAGNLERGCRAFPFLATCGVELDRWSSDKSGLLERFWVETIKELALETAVASCYQHIQENFQPGTLAMMNPGSLEDWPIGEQGKLLGLLGAPISAIDVHLTESSMMVPVKSLSGILFPNQEGFLNCRLCPREKCSSRMAPFDRSHP